MTKGDYDEKIRTYVKNGGTFITTYFSGYVDENDLVITGGYPGKLRDILGIWVEEIDALPPGYANSFDFEGKEYPCRLLCELMHLEGAKALTSYKEDFYAGMPVVTKNTYGNGTAYYVGTSSDAAFYETFLEKVCMEKQVKPVAEVPEGVEAVMRSTEEHSFLFLLNHTKEEKNIRIGKECFEILTEKEYNREDTLTLSRTGVAILQM